MKKERTQKQLSKDIENTISDIRKVLYALPIISKYVWFDEKKFKEIGFEELLMDTCRKYNTNEKNIRLISGWNDNKKIFSKQEIEITD